MSMSRRRRDLRVQIAAAQAIEPGDGDALPERLVLFPGDPLEAATDGRRHVVTDAAEVVAETLRHAPSDGRRPVTFDHAGLYYGAVSAPAGGWLSDFRVESDGAISAAVAWTPRGSRALIDREYRYISAEYEMRRAADDERTWEVLWFVGASLVNRPGFDLPALAAAASAGLGGDMDIRKLLGLEPDASDEEVAAATAEWQRDREVASAARKALSLEADADAAAITTAAAAAAPAGAGTGSDPDPAQYVPRTQYDELVVRVAGLESQRSSEGAERAVAAAVEAGVIAPSQREWALQYASSDLAEFEKYAKAAPRIFGPGTPAAEAAAAAAAGGDAEVRTSAEREVIAKLGLAEDAYAKSAAEVDGRAGRS